MNKTTETQQEIDQEACKILGQYRRRLRAHAMLPEDEDDLAGILDWVEEYVISPGSEVRVLVMSLLAALQI